ncbi:High mobility group protein B1 [Lemmus lemmus]
MGKGDPKKPRGKMSSYAFFVQTCREERKRKHPDASVNFSEFSKKCSERSKTMSAKEKGTFEDIAKADKPYGKKAAKLKKYEKEIAAYRAKGKPDAGKKWVVKEEKSKKKKEEEDDEEDEEDEEEEKEEEDKDEEEDDDDE